MTSPATDAAWDQREIEAFIFREARLADEQLHDEWEQLWTDDAIYWVPIGKGDSSDPGADVSVIYDNRRRISTRLNQLRTGRRYAQSPPSRTRRVVSNCEVRHQTPQEAVVEANFIIAEHRARSTELWSGRTSYTLRHTEQGLRMSLKKVVLINSDDALPTLAFLI